MGCALPKMRFWHAQEIVHEICFELTKQISVSGRALPSAARFEGHTFQSARKFTLSAKAAGMRPMGCALPKMRFWHAQEIVHEICFVLTKQISVSGRGNPNGFPLAAAYFRAHRKGMPRLHPFRKPCGKSGEKPKSVILDFSRNRLVDFVLSCQNKIFR